MNKQKPRVTRIAAYGIVIDNDHILLCRLSDYLAHAGMWTLPGGGLESGEHPETGIGARVEEETGLIVRPAGVARRGLYFARRFGR
ncbi:MAG: NUDIX domain-containing protein [Gammaproteobacteria bacterium]|nr:NUDIX domain-containing protein [Gammaproteobacteria bacterium]